MAKPKKVPYELIERPSPEYEIMDAIIASHHPHLKQAGIYLAWRKGWKASKDNHLILGTAQRASDLSRELAEHDFVICLNAEAWATFDAERRRALVDHELCHCTRDLDKNGVQKTDERGRLCWRMREHDIEEFTEIINRHGFYKKDLQAFAEAVLEAATNEPDLFGGREFIPHENAEENSAPTLDSGKESTILQVH